MVPYEFDEDGYETEATILLDPLEEADTDGEGHPENSTKANTTATYTKLDMEEEQSEQADVDALASHQSHGGKKQENFEKGEEKITEQQAEAATGKDQGMI